MTATHRSDFLRDVKTEFPALRDAVNSWGGLLHLEVAEFGRFVQVAIDAGEGATVARAFRIAERHFLTGRPALRNAIAVSFLEHLNFDDEKLSRRWAWTALPTTLQDAFRSLAAQASTVPQSVRPARRTKS